jgi:cobalamin biosynthesis protein CobD/CbiB
MYSCFAVKDLGDQAETVRQALDADDIELARQNIVGLACRTLRYALCATQ